MQAVRAVQSYIEGGRQKTGKSCIEQIARVYGRQAVVISVDPRRVYVNSPDDTPHACVQVGAEGNGAGGPRPGPNGEQYCWYRCTTKGARGQSELDVPTLVAACAELGAGEILLNLIDNDGVGEVRACTCMFAQGDDDFALLCGFGAAQGVCVCVCEFRPISLSCSRCPSGACRDLIVVSWPSRAL